MQLSGRPPILFDALVACMRASLSRLAAYGLSDFALHARHRAAIVAITPPKDTHHLGESSLFL
jgi:hypothetical protein